jgi:hypothetical protein
MTWSFQRHGAPNAFCCAETNRLSDRRIGYRPVSYRADNYHRTTADLGRIMRNLTKRGIAAEPLVLPKGLAFEIADLILVKNWAGRHDFEIMVRLDHGAEDEEYEEVIAFHAGIRPSCRLIMWRNADAVFIQPLPGRRQRHASVADALRSLLVKRPIMLTDILATVWPADA